MPPMRGCGSWPVVFIILALFFVSVVQSANITAPNCKTKFNSTLKITVIPDPRRVRRADQPLGGNPGSVAPRCNARFNSTLKITEFADGLPVNGTVPKVGRIRRADQPPRAKSAGAQSPGGQSLGGQSPGARSPGVQSPGAQQPGAQSPGAPPPGGQSSGAKPSVEQWLDGQPPPEAQSPGGSSIGSSVYDAKATDGDDWPARYGGGKPGSGSGTSAQMPDSGDEESIDYDGYVSEGIGLAHYLERSDDEVTAALEASGHLEPGEQLASEFKDVSEFKSNGWNMADRTPYLLKDFNSQAPFGTALKSLRVSDKARPEGKHEYTEYEHTLPYMLDGVEEKPVGQLAKFGFVTDPQDACLIISVAYSTQYWIDMKSLDKHFGSESPPLSHQSDMAFLDWKRACTKYNTNTNTLKHIFLSVITTPATKEVVHHVYEAKMGHALGSMGDLPLWDQRITVEPGTDEFFALFATVQIKGIMWMLLQHREQLGKKTIKRMCIFKDEITGVVPGNEPEERGPSIYLELKDVQSGGAQSGGTQSGGVKSGDVKSGGVKSGGVQAGSVDSGGVKSGGMQSARLRRADNPPGGASEESGSSQSDDSNESEGSNGRAPLPPLNAVHLAPYIRHGEVAAAYMRASDEEITADLVRKGVYTSGQKLASPFTDHSAFKSSGWEEGDALDIIQGPAFDWYVPFSDALQSLSISNKPQPEGKLEHTTYEHRLPWKRNGQTMNPVGRRATFQYVTTAEDACIIMTMMYTTQYIIRDEGLTGIESPPLSHSSDIAFLEWKRACEKSQTDVKSLKHIFISVIVTPSTQDVVATVLKNMGTPITDRADFWNNQLPGWEQKLTFQPDSDEGKALYGTVQVKGIMWMLVQHREHLGHTAIKSVSVFRGGNSPGEKVFGPTFYIELEDVQSGGVQPAAGQSEVGQAGAKQQLGAVPAGAGQLRSKL